MKKPPAQNEVLNASFTLPIANSHRMKNTETILIGSKSRHVLSKVSGNKI